MRQLGNIDQATYEAAVQEPITARRHITQAEVDADYVAEMARQYAVERFGDDAYTGGYRIHTTLDSELQPHARNALANGLIDYDTRHGWRGPEQRDIPSGLAEAQARTERRGLEEELDESPRSCRPPSRRQSAARPRSRASRATSATGWGCWSAPPGSARCSRPSWSRAKAARCA